MNDADISPEHKIFWSLPLATLRQVHLDLAERADEKRGTDDKLNAVANLARNIYARRA